MSFGEGFRPRSTEELFQNLEFTKKVFDSESKHTLVPESQNIEDVLKENEVTLLQFSADWCGPCRMLTPIIEGLSKEYKENGAKVTLGKVNVDLSPELGQKYGVRNIPTVILLKNGVVVDEGRMVGAQSKDAYKTKIDALLN